VIKGQFVHPEIPFEKLENLDFTDTVRISGSTRLTFSKAPAIA